VDEKEKVIAVKKEKKRRSRRREGVQTRRQEIGEARNN